MCAVEDLTCVIGNQALHDLETIELGCIVHGSVALSVYGIQDLALATFGQPREPLLHHVLAAISGGLEARDRKAYKG